MLRTWAKKLGPDEAESLLAETPEEERSDERLPGIVEGLMASQENEEPEGREDEGKKNEEAEAKLKERPKN